MAFETVGPQLPLDEMMQQASQSEVNSLFAPGFIGGPQSIASRRPMPPSAMPNESNFGMPRQSMEDLIAPYRETASKLASPYLMFQPNSWIARNHPGLAGVLDNALASVALSRFGAPASAGQNISAALGGALEASQLRRQHLIQQATLPYQLMMPQMQAQREMAQTEQERTAAMRNLAYLPYLAARSEEQLAMANKAGAMRPVGKALVDQQGSAWQQVMGPETGGLPRFYSPSLQRYASPEEELAFAQQSRSGSPNVDYTLSGILRRKAAGDPKAESDLTDYIRAQGGVAGSRAASTQAATQPTKEQEAFLKNELSRQTRNLPKIEEKDAWIAKKSQSNFLFSLKDQSEQDAAYQAEMGPKIQQRDQKLQDLAQYEASGVHRNKVGYDDWKKGKVAPSEAPTSKSKSAWSDIVKQHSGGKE